MMGQAIKLMKKRLSQKKNIPKSLLLKEILEIYKKELKKDYVNIYFHADYEGIRGINIFESVLKLLKGKPFSTYSELLEKQ